MRLSLHRSGLLVQGEKRAGAFLPAAFISLRSIHAAGLGLEPRYTAPEAVVLPLDDPAIRRSLADISYFSAPSAKKKNRVAAV